MERKTLPSFIGESPGYTLNAMAAQGKAREREKSVATSLEHLAKQEQCLVGRRKHMPKK